MNKNKYQFMESFPSTLWSLIMSIANQEKVILSTCILHPYCPPVMYTTTEVVVSTSSFIHIVNQKWPPIFSICIFLPYCPPILCSYIISMYCPPVFSSVFSTLIVQSYCSSVFSKCIVHLCCPSVLSISVFHRYCQPIFPIKSDHW